MPRGKGTYGTAVGRPRKKPGTLKPTPGLQKPMRAQRPKTAEYRKKRKR